MQLTNEVLEMWEADAQRGSTDTTAANARVLRLIEEVRDDSEQLAEMTARLIGADPAFAESVRIALTPAGREALGEAA